MTTAMTEFGDVSFGDFDVAGFDSFKITETHSTAVESLQSRESSEGQTPGVQSGTSEKKKKKKKKSSKSERSERSSKSSRRGSSDSAKERELITRMTSDKSNGFDDFDDFDGFEEPTFPERGSYSDAGSRRSNVSQKTPATHGMTTTSLFTSSSDAYTGGATSSPSQNASLGLDGVEVEFPDEDFFSPEHQPNFDDYGGDEDDESILSELSGLTGVFTSLDVGVGPSAEQCEEEAADYLRGAWEPTVSTYGATQSPSLSGALIKESAPKNKKQNKKSLTFSTVSIRLYERIMTENPATIKGISIGIGWRYTQKPEEDVTKYEYNRGTTKPSALLVIGPDARENLLLDLGYTRKDLAIALRSINKARNQRRQTVQNLKAEKVEEALEGAGKRVKSILNPFKRKK